MYRRIVVPLDGTSFGRSALQLATGIACRAKAEIELVHVHLPAHLEPGLFDLTPFHFTGVVPADAGLDRQELRREAEQLENEARALCQSAGLRVTSRAVAGTIDSAIEREARTFGADLIVMSTHDPAGSERVLLGSVGHAVLRRATIPVLLVRPPVWSAAVDSPTDIRRILVPLDGSPFSERVLEPAVDLARLFGARIHLLYVDVPLRTRIPDERLRTLQESQTPHAPGLSYLQAIARTLPAAAGDPLIEVVTASSAASAILEAAIHGGADAIAMATHGRRGLRRRIIGSTADEVLLHTRLPVLLYRGGKYDDARSVIESAATAHTIL
jgi:nucleotide-binding universal stress UspA family protein